MLKITRSNDFFAIEHLASVLCLICQETITVQKEYNIKRHYNTKHESKFHSVVGQARTDRINPLKQSIAGQQSFLKVAISEFRSSNNG